MAGAEVRGRQATPNMTMTCHYTYAFSTAACVASHPPSTAAVRLFSLHNSRYSSPTSKIIHLVRHAEGTHNVSEDHKTPAHLDATLTAKGVGQCHELAKFTRNLELDAVLVSPLTRCLETARLSFPRVYGAVSAGDDLCNNGKNSHNNNHGENNNNMNTNNSGGADGTVPFVAYEEWRETVNYLCDSRRTRSTLQKEYPRVNFDQILHDHDPLWAHYEEKFGCYETHALLRESRDAASLYNRAHSAWSVLLHRPERKLALVGHSAFFMHCFTPLFEELEGVVQYEDDDVRDLMTKGLFDNCELRSVVVDFPREICQG